MAPPSPPGRCGACGACGGCDCGGAGAGGCAGGCAGGGDTYMSVTIFVPLRKLVIDKNVGEGRGADLRQSEGNT